MEDLMTVSEKVDALQKRAADLKGSFEAARTETNEQVRARISKAKADAARAQDEVNAKAAQAADTAQSRWAAMKADVSAKVSQMQEDIDRKRDERDVKAAQRDADNTEDDALDALDFAAWAVDQAEISVLDAIDARAWADARTAASSSG
jgi:Holliday junction resolvase RusA-like endonuclease